MKRKIAERNFIERIWMIFASKNMYTFERNADYVLENWGRFHLGSVAKRDKKIEKLWDKFLEVPVHRYWDETDEEFLHFQVGTKRQEIWDWFDEQHSRGVLYLLFRSGIENYPGLKKIYYSGQKCFECLSQNCALNPDGLCLYPILHGNIPEYRDDTGCEGFTCKE